MTNPKHINLIIMPIPVDKGMAGTARLRNFVNHIPADKVTITNVVLGEEAAEYTYGNTRIIKLPTHHMSLYRRWKTIVTLITSLWQPDQRNLLLNYDVPHTPFRTLLIQYLRKKPGYKVIVDVVEDYNTFEKPEGWRGRMRVWYSGLVFKKLRYLTDGAIGISHYLMRCLDRYAGGKPVVHLPITFDPESVIAGNGSIDERRLNVFYGGTFGDKDGIEYLVEGFKLALEKHPHAELHMTGQGSPSSMEKFRKIREGSGIAEKIHYHGFLPYEDYCALLSNADVMCVTRVNSAFANAGFPYKLGEFLASGKPVIVSKLPEVLHYLDEGSSCLVAPESPREISQAITTLSSQEIRHAMGLKGRKIAYAHFDARKVAQSFYNFLDSFRTV